MKKQQKLHWLYRPENRKKLWKFQYGLLILALLPELFVHHHAYFDHLGISLETSFGFYAWYGFATCALMVVGAKLLGFMLKRKDTYYHD